MKKNIYKYIKDGIEIFPLSMKNNIIVFEMNKISNHENQNNYIGINKIKYIKIRTGKDYVISFFDKDKKFLFKSIYLDKKDNNYFSNTVSFIKKSIAIGFSINIENKFNTSLERKKDGYFAYFNKQDCYVYLKKNDNEKIFLFLCSNSNWQNKVEKEFGNKIKITKEEFNAKENSKIIIFKLL